MQGTWKKTLPIALAVLLIAGAAIAGGAAIKAKHATASKSAAAGHCDGHDAAMAAGTACEGHDAAMASGGTCADHEANVAAGTACTDHDAAMASGTCPVSGATAKMAANGTTCPYMDENCDPSKGCSVKANQAMYSFAVPGASCDACVGEIQRTTMAMKGVSCVHVDLDHHIAYIIADKSVTEQAIAKAISEAGYHNSYKGAGKTVEAEFAKAMHGAGPDASITHCAHKTKDKV
ncbi:MAG: heavy-metal-associated domain-containing protein [Hyphomicrobiales bacterium]